MIQDINRESNGGFGFTDGELSLEFTKADHPTVDLIPKPEFDGFEAAKESKFRGLLEEGM